MVESRGRFGRVAVAAALVAVLALGACTKSDDDAGPGDVDGLATITDGKFTVATGEPAYEPWVVADDPASGEGFEAAVAYAVAKELGFAEADVVWVRTTFDAAIAPGAKIWDVNIQQFSITAERAEAVDFSSPYYTTAQAIVTYQGSPAEAAKSVADLKAIGFGVQLGTTSATELDKVVAPDEAAKIFSSSDDVVHALVNRQVDAIVVDLPSAFYITAAQMDDGVIVGQLAPSEDGEGDQFGFVLPKDSALTAPVSAAVDALRADGTLAKLETQWLSDAVGVPVLK
jgi:polar amino acid transport system substrate-binding protein